MKRIAHYGILPMPAVRIIGLFLLLAMAGCASTGSEPSPAPVTAGDKPIAEPPAVPEKPEKPAVAAPLTPSAPPPAARPADEKAGSAAAPAAAPEKAPAKVAAAPAPKDAAAKKPVAAPAPEKPTAPPPLDLDTLEQRLKDTNAIGVFTKLTLKNQVDDLVERFKAYYAGRAKTTLAELRQPYDSLILKVLTLLQDGDPSLANAIRSSREAIWGILSDPAKFSKLAS